MKIGFREVDEQEQKINRSLDKSNRIFTVIEALLLCLMAILVIFCVVYYGIRVGAYGDSPENFFNSISMLGVVCGSIAFAVIIMNLIEYVQKKSVLVSPELGRVDGRKEYSLKNALSIMKPKVAVIVWDVLVGLILFSMVFAQLISEEIFNPEAWVRNSIVLSVMLPAGHFLFGLLYRNRSYHKKMLKTTKKYLDIGSDDMFCHRVDQSLRNSLLFCSKQFCFTTDYLMGYADTDVNYQIAAIPTGEIEAMQYFVRRENNGRVTIEKGILACRLKNGKVIHFYLGMGKMLSPTLNALNYYRINYSNDGNPVFANEDKIQ